MDSAILALKLLLILGAIVFTLLFAPKKINPVTYLSKTERGRGIAAGILMALGVFLLAVLWPKESKAGEIRYLNWADVYFGLDHTKKISPQCEPGEISDRVTSNIGVRLNVLESHDSRTTLNAKYTHHSCAFNVDAAQYDAFGFELSYKFWAR